MCCLFGLLDYSHGLSLKRRQEIIRTLSIACEERGTDATGIAYFTGGRLYVQKAPRAAHRMKLHVRQDAHTIMGHTRMTTQGDESKNYNNHPFAGKAGKLTFALAHNGVLHNDKSLRISRQLPVTKIETDSYVAVQLIEQKKVLDFSSLRSMAESLRGTFTITVLDANNTLYIVKGNNPLCLYHFEEAGFYLYASTKEILDKAVKRLHLDCWKHCEIKTSSGEILRIPSTGSMKRSFFRDDALWDAPLYTYWDWPGYSGSTSGRISVTKNVQEELLEMYSQISGYDPGMLAMLHDAGFDWMDIEQMIYDPALMDECLAEVLYE